MNSRCFRFREYGSAHRANVGNRPSPEVQHQSVCATQNKAHTSCASLALCDGNSVRNSVPPLCNICTATFCAVLSQSLLLVFGALLVVGWLCSECAEKINMRGEDRSQVSLKFTHEHVSFIKFLQSFNAISKSPDAAGLGTYPPTLAQTSLLTLAGGKTRRSAILLAQRRIMSSIAIGTISAFGVPLCSECFFFAHCPSSSSSLQRVDVPNLF